MVTEIWVKIGSGNGLLPDSTKPLPGPMLTDHPSVRSRDIHIRAISQQMPQPSITKICLKITYLKFHSNFPGANELTGSGELFIVIITDILFDPNFWELCIYVGYSCYIWMTLIFWDD